MSGTSNGSARFEPGRGWVNPAAPLREEARPFQGHPLERSRGIRSQFGPAPYPELLDAFGRSVPNSDDPAFQPPRDPLPADLRARASIVHREVPIVTTNTGYSPQTVREAIESMVIGLFDQVSQLTDTVLADSRVQATMASRTGGLLGRPMKFSVPKGFEHDDEAKLALRVWHRNWDQIFTEAAAGEFLRWTIMHGWGAAQVLWDTSRKFWIPSPAVWHPRYSYYHWLYRSYVAITQDGQVPITPGDGTWVLHAPHGSYRGWMRGAVWSIAPWWLARNYALRDWARYSERHGMPIIKALTPAAGDPGQIASYRAELSNLGQDTIVQLPQGVEPQYSYGIDLLEATDQGWQGFHQLIEQCNAEITLAIMAQTLTTEVKEGSFAAARVHADVRQALLESDARSLERTIHEQIARPFAAMNWGRPEIAPVTQWCLDPVEDNETKARTFQLVAAGIMALRRGGKEIRDLPAFVKEFGLDMRLADVADVAPLQGGTGGGHT
jgi:phage gp29-like protein